MSFTVVLLIMAGLVLCCLVLPWAVSSRFRRAFARVSQRGPFPHEPAIDIVLWTLLSLWLVEVGLAQPGRWVTVQIITMCVTAAAMGGLVLLSWERRAEGRYDELRDRPFDSESESGEKPRGRRGVRSAAPVARGIVEDPRGEGSLPLSAADTPVSAPKGEDLQAGDAAKSGTGRLVVWRPRGVWRDVLRSYRIEVDGVFRVAVRRGQVFELEVPAGRHVVRARIDWTGSPEMVVDVHPGSSVTAVVEPAEGGSFLNEEDYLSLSVTSSDVG